MHNDLFHDVQRGIGPGLGHIEQAGVLLPKLLVLPEVAHPHHHKQQYQEGPQE